MKYVRGATSSVIDWLSMAGANVSSCAVLIMSVLVTADVLLRWLFNAPTAWTIEVAGYLLVIVISLSLAYTLKTGGHIRVTIVADMLPVKIKAWSNVIIPVMALVYTSLFSYLTLKQTLISFTNQTTSGTAIETIIWPVQLFMPLGLVIISLVLIVNVYTGIKVALGKSEKPNRER